MKDKEFRINWTEVVDYGVNITAKNKKEAIKNFHGNWIYMNNVKEIIDAVIEEGSIEVEEN